MRCLVAFGLLCTVSCAPKVEATAGSGEPAPEASPTVEAETAVVEVSGTRALVLADDTLLRMAPSGRTEPVVSAIGWTECRVDESYGVTWLASDTELAFYDPKEERVTKVATGIARPEPGIMVWRVQHRMDAAPFPFPSAGTADGLEDCVALVVDMDAAQIGGAAVSEGDRDWYCFVEDTIGSDEPKLVDEQLAVKAAYDKAELVGKEALVALEARRKKDGSLTRPRTSIRPTAPEVTVEQSPCEEGGCGAATYLGGGRLWKVVTSNSRGDFFHEGWQIYDTKTKTWWDLATDEHTDQPSQDGESGRMNVSPDGSWAVFGGKVLSLSDATLLGTITGEFCGWE